MGCGEGRERGREIAPSFRAWPPSDGWGIYRVRKVGVGMNIKNKVH